MGKKLDISGKTFNRLTAICISDTKQNGKYFWVFKCICGKTIKAIGSAVVNGNTKSCGCKNIDNITKHGDSHHRFYKIWKGMKGRCLNKKDSHYAFYGGRGIKVCDRWLLYENFKLDMLSSYSKELSIDRINVNGNYEPQNCRWATREEQDNNTRRSVIIDTPWGRMSVSQCARKIGIHKSTLSNRIKKNFPAELMFSKQLKTPQEL